MNEVVVGVVRFDRLFELCCSEGTEAVNLILHRHGEDLGMLDDVNSWWGCDGGLDRCRSGPLGSDWSVVGRRCSIFDRRRRRFGVWKVVEVVEEVDHEFHYVRIIAGVVSVLGGFRPCLNRLQLDGAAFAFLLHVNMAFIFDPVVKHTYFERILLERGPEVAGLSHENDLVKVELVRSADDFAIRVLFRDKGPSNYVSFEANPVFDCWTLLSQALLEDLELLRVEDVRPK